MVRILAIAALVSIVGVGVLAYVQSGTNDAATVETAASDATTDAADTNANATSGEADAAGDDAAEIDAAGDAAEIDAAGDAAGIDAADDAVAAETSISESAVAEQQTEPALPAAPAGPDIETPPVLGARGDLENLDGWLQSDITSLDELDGTVHVVQFWTFGCFNCKNTLDNMAALYARHADDDFEVVGVHAPEFDYEKDPDSILAAAENLNVTWPIALDTEKTNFRSWQEGRRFWPRTFVVDQEGQIRFDRIGEGAYEKLNNTVAWLLANPPA